MEGMFWKVWAAARKMANMSLGWMKAPVCAAPFCAPSTAADSLVLRSRQCLVRRVLVNSLGPTTGAFAAVPQADLLQCSCLWSP
jgi:hypothetical protein